MKTSAPALYIVDRLPHPGALDVDEALYRGAGEVPCTGGEIVVKVRDEVVLAEVDLDTVEQLRHDERPELVRGDRVAGQDRSFRGRRDRCFPLFLPPGRVEVLGVDAVLVGGT
ncbi:hypothetical protein MRBLWO14_000991 [Microbacterium sp. LWO14-1.2]|uniref:hypothetical protein n=1 Tax=Microbacterium sp. LWO14-1.2 TaxID=3135263 RepID=UPI0031394867